jgi:8-oxo-dGTP diphosphatase
MKTKTAAGGVVYCRNDAGQLRLLLIHDKYGDWTLPKGHLKTGETEEQAAYREIAEETSVRCTIGPLVQRIRYEVNKKGTWYDKTVAYFLATTACVEARPEAEEGISAACWVEPEAAIAMIGYDQVREVVQQALAMIDAGGDASP